MNKMIKSIHEEQDDCSFQNQHPAVGLVVVEKLVKVVERLEFLSIVRCQSARWNRQEIFS